MPGSLYRDRNDQLEVAMRATAYEGRDMVISQFQGCLGKVVASIPARDRLDLALLGLFGLRELSNV
jgi:hypothetical protein